MYCTALDSMGRTITILFLAFLLFCFFINFIYFVLSLVTYLLKGKGISTMAKKLGVPCPDGAYIPVYRHKIFGDVADAAAARPHGKPKRNYGKILMGLNISIMILAVIAIGIYLFALSTSLDNSAPRITMIRMTAFFGYAFTLLLLTAANVTFAVITFIAYYRIFLCFSPDSAVLWLLLAILVNPAGEILVYAMSKSEPVPPAQTSK